MGLVSGRFAGSPHWPHVCAPTLRRLQRRAHMGFLYCSVCGRVVDALCVEEVCVLCEGGYVGVCTWWWATVARG